MADAWDYSTESLWTLAPRVILGTTVIAIVYGEIRLRTGSVWPAVIMHASGNAVAGAVINTDNVLVQNEPVPWLFAPGVDGVVVIAISAALAAALFMNRRTSHPPMDRAGRNVTMTTNDNNHERSVSRKSVLTPGAGAGMGVGVGAALTAATGDGWWIAGFAGFGAVIAIALNTLHSGALRQAN